jgi:NADH:ubiquinone oxidoreductase subunit 3 (subunit A)
MFENIDYFSIIIFLLLSIGIAKLLLDVHYFLLPKIVSLDKMLGYECGYDPFDNARNSFNVQFYLVSILFLIFDLEIAFVFPWAVSINSLGLFGIFIIFFFLSLLGIGFIFEYKKGALYW